jgi:hypothetical protein
MYSELDQLTRAIDSIREDEARSLVDEVNNKLCSLLGAHIVDVLWRSEGRDGPILQPYIWLDKTTRGGPKGYTVTVDSPGVWTWAFFNKATVWLESVKGLEQSEACINLRNGKTIEPKYLDVFDKTDSIVVVPLERKDTVRGIYSIEIPVSGHLSDPWVDLIERLAFPIANLI